jgi:hypothetical protein
MYQDLNPRECLVMPFDFTFFFVEIHSVAWPGAILRARKRKAGFLESQMEIEGVSMHKPEGFVH